MESVFAIVFAVMLIILAYQYVTKQKANKRRDAVIEVFGRETAKRYLTTYKELEKTKAFKALSQDEKYARLVMRLNDDVRSMKQAHERLQRVRGARWSSNDSSPLTLREIVEHIASNTAPAMRGNYYPHTHDDDACAIRKGVSRIIPEWYEIETEESTNAKGG